MVRRIISYIMNWIEARQDGLSTATVQLREPTNPPVDHLGGRRLLCWWEPIYSSSPPAKLDFYDWDIERDSGPVRCFVSGNALTEKATAGNTFKVKDLSFNECDFQGSFENTPIIMFDSCNFINCDFAHSTWKDTHFRACTFQDTSISLATFERCEFRDCEWIRIGLGSKTDVVRTYVNNPARMLNASISRTNPKDPTWEHKFYQWYRLKGTRAHFLRTMMLSHQITGDEATYYEIVRLHEMQRSTATISEEIYKIIFKNWSQRAVSTLKLPFHLFDYLILRCFGWLNNWGSSVARPFVALLFSQLIFGLIYKFGGFKTPVPDPFQKSFDITMVVGYTNQKVMNDPGLLIVQNIHILISIAIYSVFFATVISKLSRAR